MSCSCSWTAAIFRTLCSSSGVAPLPKQNGDSRRRTMMWVKRVCSSFAFPSILVCKSMCIYAYRQTLVFWIHSVPRWQMSSYFMWPIDWYSFYVYHLSVCLLCVGLPGGLCDSQGGQFTSSWSMGFGAFSGWHHLLSVAVFRHDRFGLLERVQSSADNRRSTLWNGR